MSNLNSNRWRRFIVRTILVGCSLILLQTCSRPRSSYFPTSNLKGTQPLVMRDGDPYIRALMRTISASEANYFRPYNVIYGGKQVKDLSHHPNQCEPIKVGVNTGRCSTAAGRYQFLYSTWNEKAKRYHPQPPGLMIWIDYSFEPEFQDRVVYAWLSDRRAWGTDISQLLRQDKLPQVLKLLSGTWTSLGYGIETNSTTSKLPRIYRRLLKEELRKAK